MLKYITFFIFTVSIAFASQDEDPPVIPFGHVYVSQNVTLKGWIHERSSFEKELKTYSDDQQAEIRTWLLDSGLVTKCTHIKEVTSLLKSTKQLFTPDEWFVLMPHLAAPWFSACQNLAEARNILDALSNLGNYRVGLIEWYKTTGALELVKSPRSLADQLNMLCVNRHLRGCLKWIRTNEVVTKCESFDDLNLMFKTLQDEFRTRDLIASEGIDFFLDVKGLSTLEKVLRYLNLLVRTQYQTEDMKRIFNDYGLNKLDFLDSDHRLTLLEHICRDIRVFGWPEVKWHERQAREAGYLINASQYLKFFAYVCDNSNKYSYSRPLLQVRAFLSDDELKQICEEAVLKEQIDDILSLVHFFRALSIEDFKRYKDFLFALKENGVLTLFKTAWEIRDFLTELGIGNSQTKLELAFKLFKAFKQFDHLPSEPLYSEFSKCYSNVKNNGWDNWYVTQSIKDLAGLSKLNGPTYEKVPSKLSENDIAIYRWMKTSGLSQKFNSFDEALRAAKNLGELGSAELQYAEQAMKRGHLWDPQDSPDQKVSRILNLKIAETFTEENWTAFFQEAGLSAERFEGDGKNELALFRKKLGESDFKGFGKIRKNLRLIRLCTSDKPFKSAASLIQILNGWNILQSLHMNDLFCHRTALTNFATILTLQFGIPTEDSAPIVEWLRSTDTRQRVIDAKQVRNLINLFSTKDEQAALEALCESNVLDADLLQRVLKSWAAHGNDVAKALLDRSAALPNRGHNHLGLYLVCIKAGWSDPHIHAFLEDKITSGGDWDRDHLILSCNSILGESHEVTQHLLMFMVKLRNQTKIGGFLGTHLELMEKSRAQVTHNVHSTFPDCVLNIDMIRQSHPCEAIHMPVTCWYDLFDALEEHQDCFEEVLQIQGVGVKELLELRHKVALTCLLDTQGSTEAASPVSSYSQMLRVILKTVQDERKEDPKNLGTFVQLLINARSCAPGKMNGIATTFGALKYETKIAGTNLKDDVFKTDLLAFLNHELRRFREATISCVSQHFTSSTGSHPIKYIRGLIGHEVGLMFEGEVISIDVHGIGSEALKQASKQRVLDVFYQYYKADDVVEKIFYLLNTGCIQIIGAADQKDLTAKLVGNIFGDDAMDEDCLSYNLDYVTVDKDGKPTGFTRQAAKELLLHTGILEKVKTY